MFRGALKPEGDLTPNDATELIGLDRVAVPSISNIEISHYRRDRQSTFDEARDLRDQELQTWDESATRFKVALSDYIVAYERALKIESAIKAIEDLPRPLERRNLKALPPKLITAFEDTLHRARLRDYSPNLDSLADGVVRVLRIERAKTLTHLLKLDSRTAESLPSWHIFSEEEVSEPSAVTRIDLCELQREALITSEQISTGEVLERPALIASACDFLARAAESLNADADSKQNPSTDFELTHFKNRISVFQKIADQLSELATHSSEHLPLGILRKMAAASGERLQTLGEQARTLHPLLLGHSETSRLLKLIAMNESGESERRGGEIPNVYEREFLSLLKVRGWEGIKSDLLILSKLNFPNLVRVRFELESLNADVEKRATEIEQNFKLGPPRSRAIALQLDRSSYLAINLAIEQSRIEPKLLASIVKQKPALLEESPATLSALCARIVDYSSSYQRLLHLRELNPESNPAAFTDLTSIAKTERRANLFLSDRVERQTHLSAQLAQDLELIYRDDPKTAAFSRGASLIMASYAMASCNHAELPQLEPLALVNLSKGCFSKLTLPRTELEDVIENLVACGVLVRAGKIGKASLELNQSQLAHPSLGLALEKINQIVNAERILCEVSSKYESKPIDYDKLQRKLESLSTASTSLSVALRTSLLSCFGPESDLKSQFAALEQILNSIPRSSTASFESMKDPFRSAFERACTLDGKNPIGLSEKSRESKRWYSDAFEKAKGEILSSFVSPRERSISTNIGRLVETATLALAFATELLDLGLITTPTSRFVRGELTELQNLGQCTQGAGLRRDELREVLKLQIDSRSAKLAADLGSIEQRFGNIQPILRFAVNVAEYLKAREANDASLVELALSYVTEDATRLNPENPLAHATSVIRRMREAGSIANDGAVSLESALAAIFSHADKSF